MIDLKPFFPTKVFKRNRKNYLFDPIRKKLILQTPEELVRQGFIQFLIKKKEVPLDMIEVEVPMGYFSSNAKGRADIIVNTIQNNKLIPILVVECKSTHTPLIDDVFDQVYDYEEVLNSNTIAVTNGDELYVETWNNKTQVYVPLEELPCYQDLVSANHFKYDTREPFVFQRLSFEEYGRKENIEAYKTHFRWVKNPNLHTFLMNLNELLWDDTVKIPYKELFGVKIIEDIGVRYTKFGNAAGYDWTGDYRSFIVEDKKNSHQIISIAILEGYIIVSIDNDQYSHNSLQLHIETFVKAQAHLIKISHNGRLTVGKSGMAKFEEVLNFVEQKDPSLLNNERKIDLGLLDNSRQFSWEQEDIKNFIGRLMKYALIRDEFREHKRKFLTKKRKKTFQH